jgi:hypothetical protein
MKKILLISAFPLIMTVYAQETGNNENLNNEDNDFGTAGGITIYGQQPIDVYVLDQINGPASERKQFIETEFLEESGFRRTGNVRYRQTTPSERALSVLHGIGHLFTFGIVPMKPFSEVEYDRLPKGKFYNFETVFIRSNFKEVTPEVLTVIELEYMLQIEFCNGIIIQDNIDYYTDENINKFERLILGLPNFPENIQKAKARYLNDLRRIKTALERRRNPSENNLRALQNLSDSFNRDLLTQE